MVIKFSGVLPGECLYVGDSFTKDIQPAKDIGMKTVWVSKDSHEGLQVDHCITSIYDLPKVLSKFD